MIEAIYRNLTRGGWSRVNAKLTRSGHASKLKGVSHHTSGLMMTNAVTNNPKSIATGCARIVANLADKSHGKGREVVAYVAGDVSEGQPTGELLGELSLSLTQGCWVLKTSTATYLNPDITGLTLAFNKVCSVYQ